MSLIYYSIWITFKLILYFLIFFFIKLRVGDFAFRLHGPLVQIRIIPSPLGWGYVSNAYSPSDGSALRQLCGPAYRGPAVDRCRPSAAAENQSCFAEARRYVASRRHHQRAAAAVFQRYRRYFSMNHLPTSGRRKSCFHGRVEEM